MASTTTNIGLTKPAGTDQALISAINGNMDIIDTKMGAVGNTSVQGQITALSDQIANVDTVTNTHVITDKIIAYRAGRVVFITCISGSYSTNANGKLTENSTEVTIPEKYRPVISANFVEPVSQKRLTIANDGKIYVDGTISNVGCRFSATYMTTANY